MRQVFLALVFILAMVSCKNENHTNLRNKIFPDSKDGVRIKYNAKRYIISPVQRTGSGRHFRKLENKFDIFSHS
jgi:hypothetical protein